MVYLASRFSSRSITIFHISNALRPCYTHQCISMPFPSLSSTLFFGELENLLFPISNSRLRSICPHLCLCFYNSRVENKTTKTIPNFSDPPALALLMKFDFIIRFLKSDFGLILFKCLFLSFSSFCLNFFLHISFVLLFSFFSSFSHVFSWNIYANLVKTAFHPPPRHFMSIS